MQLGPSQEELASKRLKETGGDHTNTHSQKGPKGVRDGQYLMSRIDPGSMIALSTGQDDEVELLCLSSLK